MRKYWISGKECQGVEYRHLIERLQFGEEEVDEVIENADGWCLSIFAHGLLHINSKLDENGYGYVYVFERDLTSDKALLLSILSQFIRGELQLDDNPDWSCYRTSDERQLDAFGYAALATSGLILLVAILVATVRWIWAI